MTLWYRGGSLKYLNSQGEKMKSEYPLLSVIVSIYNQERYLEKCVLSIIHQSYKNLEIILVNDGSLDGSADVCKKFSIRDERITILEQKNAGPVSARKAGLNVAKGEYVIFIDGDDWLDLDIFESLYQAGIQYNVDMVGLHGCIKEYEDGISEDIVMQSKVGIYKGIELENDIYPNMISTTIFYEENLMFSLWAYAVRRDLIKKCLLNVDNAIRIGDDFACIWPCLLSSNCIAFTDRIGYHYRQHQYSLTHSFVDGETDCIKLWYLLLREKSKEHRLSSILLKQLELYTSYRLLLTDYSLFLKESNYMYPYSQIKKGDKIVIYGAGILGQKMERALIESDFCKVVLWVDKAFQRYRESGLSIASPDEIIVCEYDYIVVAAIKYKMSIVIKSELQDKYKISEDKIALVDISKITQEALFKALRI